MSRRRRVGNAKARGTYQQRQEAAIARLVVNGVRLPNHLYTFAKLSARERAKYLAITGQASEVSHE